MKICKAKIQGRSPLLIHGFSIDFGEQEKVSAVSKDYGTPRQQAEGYLYCDDDGKIWIPSSWVKGSVMDVSSEYKIPKSRKSLKSVAGGVIIPCTEKIYFCEGYTRADIEVDSRPVVIQRARIMRHRPRLEEWSLEFEFEIEETIIPVETVYDLLVDAGKRVGIGDFRPRKGGPFGRFSVVAWEVFKETVTLSAAV